MWLLCVIVVVVIVVVVMMMMILMLALRRAAERHKALSLEASMGQVRIFLVVTVQTYHMIIVFLIINIALSFFDARFIA